MFLFDALNMNNIYLINVEISYIKVDLANSNSNGKNYTDWIKQTKTRYLTKKKQHEPHTEKYFLVELTW